MRKSLIMFVALIAMTAAANATDYTGTVYNIVMGTKTPDPVPDITFSLNGDILTGNVDVPIFPPHHIDLTANVANLLPPNASGTVTVYFETMSFTGHVSGVVKGVGSTLSFHFVGWTETDPSIQVSFDFSGTAVSE
jgi:hypothetical protein